MCLRNIFGIMTYNNSVLVGNWSEERLKNDYELKLFIRKRERQDLLIQKSRTLFTNLLCERPLKLSGTYVQYGFNAQVVASDMPAKPKLEGEKQNYGLAMSILVRERQVDYMQNICDGCLMTLSPILTPCCRNTFIVVSAKDERISGKELKYGDEFLLKAENYEDPTAASLYVRYSTTGVPEPADRMPMRLSSVKDINCRFTTMPLLPCDRLEGLGSPVKTGARLIIKNLVADQSLCVMNQNWMQTFFGPECGVKCGNFKDIHGRFTAENVFTLVSDVATKSKN